MSWCLLAACSQSSYLPNLRLRKAEVQLSFCVTCSHQKLPGAGSLSKPQDRSKNRQALPKA